MTAKPRVKIGIKMSLACIFWWHITKSTFMTGGAGKARFNVATPTYEARTRPLHTAYVLPYNFQTKSI